MHLASRKSPQTCAVPLQGAVLCVNCECVTISHHDQCPVCGSSSLLNIGPLLGGAPLPETTLHGRDALQFDLTITLELRQLNTLSVNAVIERISRLIGPRLAEGRAGFHANVQPVSRHRGAERARPAESCRIGDKRSVA
jgi:hypothetical protein